MRCTPGCLAVVIRGLNGFSVHSGKIVRCIDLAYTNHPVLGPIWNIELMRPIEIASVNLNTLKGNGPKRPITRAHSPDDWLRPLPGDTTDDDIVNEVEAPASTEPAVTA